MSNVGWTRRRPAPLKRASVGPPFLSKLHGRFQCLAEDHGPFAPNDPILGVKSRITPFVTRLEARLGYKR